MIGRRVLRAKAFQCLFAYFSGEKENSGKFESDLFMSIQRLYEAYLFFLVLPIELKKQALRKIEERKNKKLPSPEDLNPNFRFVHNRIIQQIENSSLIAEKVKEYSISWSAYEEEIRKLYKVMESSSLYKNYMSSPDNSFEADQQFILGLYDEVISEFELLYDCFSDKSIFWDVDDIDLAIDFVKKTISLLKESFPAAKPGEMFNDPEDDKQFLKDLFRLTIRHDKELDDLINPKIQKWDPDRIALTDKIIMKMALCEILYHPNIPVKVSLNEYIDLAKIYSSPESHAFINGILDKIVAELNAQNHIIKTGRGLLNN